jgi:hypothetical protein
LHPFNVLSTNESILHSSKISPHWSANDIASGASTVSAASRQTKIESQTEGDAPLPWSVHYRR